MAWWAFVGNVVVEKISEEKVRGKIVHDKLALTNATPQPVKRHVDAFGSALLDGVAAESNGKIVASQQWGGWLGVAHGRGDVAERYAVLGNDEGGAVFGLTGRRHHYVDDWADSVDDAVTPKVCDTTSHRASLGAR
jgi:hypothetical protein